MASTRRKSAAIALAVVGIAGLSLAAAAQLTITSDQLGAGAIAVGSCDEDGVLVAYTTALSSGVYTVDEVIVSDIDAGCDTQTMKVALDGVQVFSGVLDATGTETIAVVGVDAEDVEDIAIVISG
jgi:hypothetical protein